jgi:hypothetical protein
MVRGETDRRCEDCRGEDLRPAQRVRQASPYGRATALERADQALQNASSVIRPPIVILHKGGGDRPGRPTFGNFFWPMSAGFKFLRPLNIVNRPYSAKKECHD